MFCHKTNRIRIINSILVFNMDINSQILDITQYRSSLKNFDHKEDPVNFGLEYLKWAVLLLPYYIFQFSIVCKSCLKIVNLAAQNIAELKVEFPHWSPEKSQPHLDKYFLLIPGLVQGEREGGIN